MSGESDGRISDTSAAWDRTVKKAAEQWQLRDEEEKEERRERTRSRISSSKRKASRNGPVITTVRVRPDVLRVALELADYDASRLEIISETEVLVR
jgi:NRPS condensation-like uncharacterized protein